jgi:hypothetical protein
VWVSNKQCQPNAIIILSFFSNSIITLLICSPWWPLCSCKSSWSLHGIKLRTAGNDSLCCHVHFQSMDAITCRVGAEMPSSLLSFQLHCTAGWPTRWELWFFKFHLAILLSQPWSAVKNCHFQVERQCHDSFASLKLFKLLNKTAKRVAEGLCHSSWILAWVLRLFHNVFYFCRLAQSWYKVGSAYCKAIPGSIEQCSRAAMWCMYVYMYVWPDHFWACMCPPVVSALSYYSYGGYDCTLQS